MAFYVCGVPVFGIEQAQEMYAIAVAGGAMIQAEAIAEVIVQFEYMGGWDELSYLWLWSV